MDQMNGYMSDITNWYVQISKADIMNINGYIGIYIDINIHLKWITRGKKNRYHLDIWNGNIWIIRADTEDICSYRRYSNGFVGIMTQHDIHMDFQTCTLFRVSYTRFLEFCNYFLEWNLSGPPFPPICSRIFHVPSDLRYRTSVRGPARVLS